MTIPPGLPEQFVRIITDLHGDEGRAWLGRLPELLAACERHWSLTLLPPFPNLSYNYAAPGVLADGVPVVLKAGVPDDAVRDEIAALGLYAGDGICRLLAADEEQGVMLLERLVPGTTLAPLAAQDDEAATAVAAEIMLRLWRPAPEVHSFPTVADWAQGLVRLREEFGGGTGPFAERLVAAAERAFAELNTAAGPPMLLHGDLHHENILAAAREPWLAIDPKGLVGDPGYEVGALLYNQLPQDQAAIRRTLARRVDQLAEALGFERARVLRWGLFQAVLSSWWSYEDHGEGWEETMFVAEVLDSLAGGAR
ncbi:MAG TPA: aminoglycoside phosphotransferase family protein [Roseiflexaceae bacterium]|nr:aminoglycoside phosphotransferase family protein [Roseiflexaceae bacterium]